MILDFLEFTGFTAFILICKQALEELLYLIRHAPSTSSMYLGNGSLLTEI